ncbi:MAG: M16 family metallopeptidase, partial [Bryobacteraceae bacterium]
MRVIVREDGGALAAARVVFRAGSAMDPAGREGVAWLAGQMLAHGGTRRRSYKQILDFLFPRGAAVEVTVDKEMTCFRMDCHADHAEGMADLLAEMLCDPGWREEDFLRLREDAVHLLEADLRGENDEELARESLYGLVFEGHPYGHPSAGRVSALRRLAVEDVRRFHTAEYSRGNVWIACAGAHAARVAARLSEAFAVLPAKARSSGETPPAATLERHRMLFVEKPAQGVAVSIGFPLEVVRGHEDYPALLVAASALGEHRTSGGRLFASLRQQRGLNYGDYAYIEYFPAPMHLLEPEPNHARKRQIFELWIRPVAPEHAHFATRLALFELERLTEEGLAEEEFEAVRAFLLRHFVLLEEGLSARLGHEIDGLYYGTGLQSKYLKEPLRELKREDVRRTAQRHLRPQAMAFAFAGPGMEELRRKMVEEAPSPVEYSTAKPQRIL